MEIFRHLWKLRRDSIVCYALDASTCILALATATLAANFGYLAPAQAWTIVLGLFSVMLLVTRRRWLAVHYLEQCANACKSERRAFATLAKAENNYMRAAHYGILAETGLLLFSLYQLWSGSPYLAAQFGLISVVSFIARRFSKNLADEAALLKISLRNLMRQGTQLADAAQLPGETALEKRYWFLIGDNDKPVATIATMYRALRQSGLPRWKAFGTSFLSGMDFGPKTQKRLTPEQKAELGIKSKYDVYIPNLVLAQSPSNSRIYAPLQNIRALKPGDVDMLEFERIFKIGAPGLDYLTAKAYKRVHAANKLRDAQEGNGNRVSRFMGKMAAGRRTSQLFMLFADRVVSENGKMVPAISKETLLRFYQGAAQADILREHEEGDEPIAKEQIPSKLAGLSASSRDSLNRLYSGATAGEIPDGESNGKTIVLPGSYVGKLLSAFANWIWKGKVFDRANGCLINKILGMRIIKAEVFKGPGWSDNREAVIVDYGRSSLVACFLRDEIREIQPGLYLGRAFMRLPLGIRTCALYFALDFRK